MSERNVSKGWKIATIVVAIVAIAAIATLSVFLNNANRDMAVLGNNLENVYQRAYYDLVANVNSMEINLSKVMVATSTNCQVDTLNELAKNSQIAVGALSTLSAENFRVVNTTRYINQAGDYATYLMKEVIAGNGIKDDDYEILDNLHQMTMQLGSELARINDEIALGNYIFTERLQMDDDVFSQVFMQLEDAIIDYPALIYDGPFSTALLEKSPKALTGEEITPEQGVTIINDMLSEMGIKDVEYTGENNGFFIMYNYQAKTANDEIVSIELSKKGGKLIMLNVSRQIDEPSLSPEECATLAEQYVADMGYSDMESVWVSNYNSIIYVNLAPVIDDVVWYPDLVKVKIASNNGDLLGVEALGYIFNHTERNLPEVAITTDQAIQNLSTNISVETIRLALIPQRRGTEVLTYEISGRVGENLYYIYVDVATGEEVQVLRVIDSDEGSLLM